MTKRQKELADYVAAHTDEIKAMVDLELADKPIGFSTSVRMLRGWDQGYLTLTVTKTPDGFSYQETSLRFYRKGESRPKPRPLPAYDSMPLEQFDAIRERKR